MFKMNAGAWIGLAGAIIGIVVAIAAVLMTADSSGLYITLGTLIIIGGSHPFHCIAEFLLLS